MHNLFYYGTKVQPPPRPIPSNYFIFLHPIQALLILMGYYLLLMAWVWPQGVSTRFYGEISRLVAHMGTHYNEHMKIAFSTLCGVNAACACAAAALCVRLRLRLRTAGCWLLQTAVFGLPSLMYLAKPQSALVSIFGEK